MFVSDAPTCHVCAGPAVFQWTRLADPLEAAAQRHQITQMQGRALSDEEIEQRYGLLRVAVTGCAEHHLGDGDADSGMNRRALVHGVDCGGHGACECGEVAS